MAVLSLFGDNPSKKAW